MNNLMKNRILDVDSYKLSHYLQFPPNTEYVYSYLEARNADRFSEFTVIGLQYLIKEYLSQPVTPKMVDDAEKFSQIHGPPFNRRDWDAIVSDYQGYLPIEIRSVDEGTVMTPRNVFSDVQNTDPRFPWLTTYVETMLLRNSWYPATVSAVSRTIVKNYLHLLKRTSDLDEEARKGAAGFALNDFGSRGTEGFEASALGGLGHLVYSLGTDNIPSICLAHDYYDGGVCAFSIPASEHATVTSWPLKQEGEKQALDNHINNFGSKELNPTGLYAFVSDSYDLFGFIRNVICGELKNKILKQDNTLVVRPDSGEPSEVVPQVLRELEKGFGAETNSKKYKVLNPKVRVIQGDGINEGSALSIMMAVTQAGFSVENVVFGCGAGLLQQIDRDTLGFSMKCSAVTRVGQDEDVFKDPATDHKKVSKKGRLSLVKNEDGNFETVRREHLNGRDDWLQPVFRNGKILRETDFEKVRNLAQSDL